MGKTFYQPPSSFNIKYYEYVVFKFVVGSSINNIGICICFGAGIGICLGIAIGSAIKKEKTIEWLKEMKKIQEVKKLNKILMDEIIEEIIIDSKRNIKMIFKCEDKYFEALDFINCNKCDIILSSENTEKIIAI